MNIVFRSSKKEWPKLTKEEILMHYSAFVDFMCMHEESMTFTEADKYWIKQMALKEFIEKKFGVDADLECRKMIGA